MIRPGSIVLCMSALACATVRPAPPPTPELQMAQSMVLRASEEKAVQDRASAQLADATVALEQAEAALARGADPQEIALLSYRVERRVRIAHWAASAAPGTPTPESLRNPDAVRKPAASPERERELRELRESALEASLAARGLIVTLDRALFDGARLSPRAQAMLDRLARFLAAHADRAVSIEGHTDNMGGADYNTRMSRERAQAVASYLQQRGVDESRLAVHGLASSQPLVPNDSPAARRLNRRVEVVIVNP